MHLKIITVNSFRNLVENKYVHYQISNLRKEKPKKD